MKTVTPMKICFVLFNIIAFQLSTAYPHDESKGINATEVQNSSAQQQTNVNDFAKTKGKSTPTAIKLIVIVLISAMMVILVAESGLYSKQPTNNKNTKEEGAQKNEPNFDKNKVWDYPGPPTFIDIITIPTDSAKSQNSAMKSQCSFLESAKLKDQLLAAPVANAPVANAPASNAPAANAPASNAPVKDSKRINLAMKPPATGADPPKAVTPSVQEANAGGVQGKGANVSPQEIKPASEAQAKGAQPTAKADGSDSKK